MRFLRSAAIGSVVILCIAGAVVVIGRNASQNPPASNDTAAGNDAPKKGVAAKTVDAVKSAASQAGDILSRVPCLPAKGVTAASLPRVATRIAAGQPVTIIAFGSSSTAGFGSSSPAFTYPNRLADQLRRKFPHSDITVVNRGVGGQDAPEMMRRFDTEVLGADPDLVIWQLGTNTVIKGDDKDVSATRAIVEDGIAKLQTRNIDIVLIDPQYTPAVTAKPENASKMVKLLGEVAKLKRVVLFPRFEVMKQWHETDKIPFDSFVISDGLHMNDWGYACFAQLLGDTIIKGVGQVKAGVDVPPSEVNTYRPL